MPVLHLLIPDAALRGALVEQLSLAEFGPMEAASDVAKALKDDELTALILDEAAADKKTLKNLRENEKKPYLFILGCAPEGSEDIFTETFPKPLRLGHIMARLQFYLKAAPKLRGVAFNFGPYKLEPQSRQITMGKDIIRLTEKETALLEYLSLSSTPVGREELLASIWGYDARIDTHTLETHIYQLRRKLDPANTGESWLINEEGAYYLKRDAG